MDIRLRAELLGRTEEEIRSEMAEALGRIGRRFQNLLEELKQLESVATQEAGPGLLQKYRDVLREARLYHWYLIVQREAMGLRDHRIVYLEYDVPASVKGIER